MKQQFILIFDCGLSDKEFERLKKGFSEIAGIPVTILEEGVSSVLLVTEEIDKRTVREVYHRDSPGQLLESPPRPLMRIVNAIWWVIVGGIATAAISAILK